MNHTKAPTFLVEIYDHLDWQKLLECENEVFDYF